MGAVIHLKEAQIRHQRLSRQMHIYYAGREKITHGSHHERGSDGEPVSARRSPPSAHGSERPRCASHQVPARCPEAGQSLPRDFWLGKADGKQTARWTAGQVGGKTSGCRSDSHLSGEKNPAAQSVGEEPSGRREQLVQRPRGGLWPGVFQESSTELGFGEQGTGGAG